MEEKRDGRSHQGEQRMKILVETGTRVNTGNKLEVNSPKKECEQSLGHVTLALIPSHYQQLRQCF